MVAGAWARCIGPIWKKDNSKLTQSERSSILSNSNQKNNRDDERIEGIVTSETNGTPGNPGPCAFEGRMFVARRNRHSESREITAGFAWFDSR